MLDVKWMRENAGLVERIAEQKGLPFSSHDFIRVDEERRKTLQDVEQLRAQRNGCSQQIGQIVREGQDPSALKQKVKEINEQLTSKEEALKDLDSQFRKMLLAAPNRMAPDTPIGETDHCYTLNNTAVASPRILIPLLENHQKEDGSFHIPRALQKYIPGYDKPTRS